MKFKITAIFVFVLFLFSCKKSETIENPSPPAPEDTTQTPVQEPLRVMQSIYTHEDSGVLVNDTTTFAYDSKGRVATKTYPFAMVETYTYSGDSLVSMKQDGYEKLRYPVDITSDSFVYDFIQVGSAIDTVRLTYIFNNGQQTEFWTYLHTTDNGCGCFPENSLQKERKYYNGDGNIIRTTLETPPDAIENDQYTVTAWDDKKNPKKTDQKVNALALALPVPLESYSSHNPTAYHNAYQSYEVEMTYNNEGYPLTYKFKDKDYISVRLIYNR